MIIYTENISERFKYILYYVFTERLGIPFSITSSAIIYKESSEPKINYSKSYLEGFQIFPAQLLFETELRKGKPTVSEQNGVKVLFVNQSDMGFDIFSAIFWMLSRYEEYMPFKADEHQRFPAKESFAFEHEFLRTPVVDVWLNDLKDLLKAKYPQLKFKEECFEVKPTIDIDNPWCFKHKGIYRTIGGIARDIVTQQWSNLKCRLLVLLSVNPDPHFVFDYMNGLFLSLNLKPKYFLHVGNYGKFDKSVSFSSRAFKLFLSKITYNNAWGVHPSYQASMDARQLDKEILRLQKVSGQELKHSRHHYLKISVPTTYQMLIAKGIERDYSMGFADKVGFRAGTTRPFDFFDLSKNTPTSLRIYPFAVMDATLKNYEQVSKTDVADAINELIRTVKSTQGVFTSLWHNESLSDYGEWKGWRKIYEKMLKDSLL